MKRLLLFTVFISSLVFVRSAWAQVLGYADANNDGTVNNHDYEIWKTNYGRMTEAGMNEGDFNSDGRVDGVDYVYWLNSFGMNVPQPSPVITVSPAPAGTGILTSAQELAVLPASGSGWEGVRSAAYASWAPPNLRDQNNKVGVSALAGALVYARTGDSELRTKVKNTIMTAKRTADEPGEWDPGDDTNDNGALSMGRQLGAYVFAADLIGLKSLEPAADSEFRDWLRIIRTVDVGTHGRWRSLAYTCENSANNWGTFACPSRLAASLYLGDIADADRVAKILRAWLGERSYYPSDAPGRDGYFQPTGGWTTTQTWTCDAGSWTAVNPACSLAGINVDGAIVEDVGRGGECCAVGADGNMYSWEALQGTIITAELLYRTGRYGNPYTWSNQAFKRALDFLARNGYNITSPSSYVAWLANKRYGTNYSSGTNRVGRIMGWGDWLYQ